MFGFIRRVFRPIASIGEKVKSIFNIGRKAEIVSDVRNTERFLDITPARGRMPKGEVNLGQGFYPDTNTALKNFNYPV
jgi:hypothetical protein